MNILIICEFDWLKKVIYEPHHLAELFSMKGHNVFVIDCREPDTKNLIDEIERSSDVRNGTNSIAYKVIQGGHSEQQGTFVCRELVYSYAMWISPRFQLLVIRAFDSMVSQQVELSERLNKLCNELSTVDAGLTSAGRFLCVGGKQIKPQLKQHIDSTIKQMQPSLNLIGGADNGQP